MYHDDVAALNILRAFGHLLGEITIVVNDNYSPFDIERFSNSLVECCSNVKQSIRLEANRDRFRLNIPFPNVTNVNLLSWSYKPNIANNIDLNRLFPRMQALRISSDTNCPLDRNYPNLIRFDLDVSLDNPKNLTKFIELNPQLQSIPRYYFVGAANFQKVSELLPSLQEITTVLLWIDGPVDDIIHFRNVKELKLQLIGYPGQMSHNLRETLIATKFDRLETFRLYAHGIADSSRRIVLDSIEQYETLTYIELSDFDLTYDELMHMVHALPQLKTLNLSCSKPGTEEVLTRFLLEENRVENILVSTVPKMCLGMDRFIDEWTKRVRAYHGYEVMTFNRTHHRN